MPRERREHEEHLESIEPVGVVLLNDVSYLVQDLAEILLDLAKLLRNRREEVLAFAGKAQEGPQAAAELIPPQFMGFLSGAGMEIFSTLMQLKGQVDADPAEEGAAESAAPRIGGVDTEKVQPEMLEALGGLIQRKAEGLESLIAGFEREILEEHPPTP